MSLENKIHGIEANRAAIKTLSDSLGSKFEGLRTDLEAYNMKTLEELARLQKEIRRIDNTILMMTPRISSLENIATKMRDQIATCKEDVRQLQDAANDLRAVKVDILDFDRFLVANKSRLDKIEVAQDQLDNKLGEQSNWMDVFMPLRIQHQIFENLREVLPRRYQHMLGLTDKTMTEALRERMLAAMGGGSHF